MTKIIGIDDAGRGPVLGPMILAGILINEEENEDLKNLGVKDSKLLLTKKRNQIKDNLTKYPHHIEITNPKEIDESDNLNYLEAIKAAMIVNKLSQEIKEEIKVIIDCPSVNLSSWCEDVKNLVNNKKIKIICEHKADLNHPSVSAASILAKEKREDEIKRLKEELQINFGSGYPADPKTKEFIENNHNNEKYKDLIRFSWNTVKKLKLQDNQKKLF